MKKWLVAIVISQLLLGGLSAQALSSIEVSDIDVKRDGFFSPVITLIFDDDTTDTISAREINLVSLQPSGFVEFVTTPFSGGGLRRENNVADTTVTANWTVTIGGVTETASSNVNVLGELSEIEVPDISLNRSDIKLPFLILKYTDETEDIENPLAVGSFGGRLYFDSFAEPNIVRIIEDPFSLDGFGRSSNVPDTLVTVNWSHTDGVFKETTSTIDVKGQLDEIEVTDININRDDILLPTLTLKYTDQTEENGQPLQTGSTGGRLFFGSFAEPDIISILENPFGASGFRRNANVPDTLVTVNWRYTDGVFKETTSTVDVKGQVRKIFVDDARLVHGERLKPSMEVEFTDNTGTTVNNALNNLASLLPDNIVRVVSSPFDGSAIVTVSSSSRGNVKATWNFTDGVLATVQSTIRVTGKRDNLVQENKDEDNGNNGDDDQSVVTTETSENNRSTSSGNPATLVQGKASTASRKGCGDCDTKCTTKEAITQLPSQKNTGDPIHINSLEFFLEAVDLQIPGRGMDFVMRRTYHSRSNFDGPLGFNWDFEFNRRFVPDPQDPNILVLYDGQMRGNPYVISGDDVISPDYHFNKVVKEDDGRLSLRNRTGTITRFLPIGNSVTSGKIDEIVTRCGNRHKYTYDSNGDLEKIIDSLSREIEFFFNNDGRLIRIRDFSGREVIYTYSSEGDLISVRSPVVTGTSTGNDFAQGKLWQYTYSTGFDDPKMNHNLLTITAPNEQGTNIKRTTNFYSSDDRIIMQEWGGTVNGVPAGGSVTYAREILNEGIDPANPDLEREKVTCIDRNSNERIYFYNNAKLLIRKEVKTRGVRENEPQAFITQHKYSDTGLLLETIFPEGNKTVYEYSNSTDKFQQSNMISVTQIPDAARGGDQASIKVEYEYDPVYNQAIKVVSPRGLDNNYIPQNGGVTSKERYTTEMIPDYFEANLDDQVCFCGLTLQQIIDKYDIDISSVQDRINQGDLNGNLRIDGICGNMIVKRLPNVNLRSESLQSVEEGSLVQEIEYRYSFNRFGQLESEETPEGEVTLSIFYPETNPSGIPGVNRTGNNNAGEPFDTGTGGYLQKIIVDQSHSARYRGNSLPTQLTSEFAYNEVGNMISILDARGVKSVMEVNQLNQTVEVISASDVSASTEDLTAFAYKTRFFYDSNNNVIESQIEIRDSNNPDLPNFLPTKYKYDILDNVIETEETISNSETRITQMRYDANENVNEIISSEAVNGNQPNNITKFIYDERDIVFSTTSGVNSLEERTLIFNVDNNGNVTTTIDAEDNNGDGEGDASTIILDGFDRAKRVIDAVGNESIMTYDPDSNIIMTEVFGPTSGPSRSDNDTSGNVLLAKTEALYDEISRVFQSDAHLFVSDNVSTVRPVVLNDNDVSPGDGKVTSFIDYDRNSRVTFTTSPSPQNEAEITTIKYDGAQRRIQVIDAENNEQLIEYDKNSNPIRITSIDVNPTGRVTNETFTNINVYDSLNRIARTTDNIGQTNYFTYSSRNLLIRTADAQGPQIADPLGLFAGNINDEGNISETKYDGLARAFESIRELRIDGEGGNPLDLSNPSNTDGKITETTTYDQNSRVLSVTDDNGNTTGYQYDNLNRLIKTVYADIRETTIEYDKDSNIIRTTDNNNNVCDYTFDAINRTIEKNISRSVSNNIEGTTLQTFEYDGLSRLVTATDNNDPNDVNDNSTVLRKYDSLSRLVEEQQNGKVISMNWREGGDLADCTYPNERVISYTQDKLNRTKTIGDTGENPIATYDYIGGRVLERVYKNNTRLTMLNDTNDTNIGYDNLPRLAQMRHLKNGNNELITGYAYGYNRVNFKEHKVNLKNPQFSELYKLDSLYRVVDFKRGTLAAGNDSINGTASQTQDWQLDGVGNWANTTVDGTAQTQTVNEVNEYDSFNGVTFVHDDNGNLTDDGERLFTYDALNRIIEINSKEDNRVIATYKYDFSNRRIEKNFQTKTAGECNTNQGESTPDANTLLLYHYNNETGPIVDSSDNGLNITNTRNTSRDDGLFNTRALRFNGKRLTVPLSNAIDNIQDQLTVETFVFLDPTTPEEELELGGPLVKRKQSYRLKINKTSRKPVFVIDTVNSDGTTTTRTRVRGDIEIPLRTWVHLAGIYDGQTVKLFVNGVEQQKVKNVSGNIAIDPTVKTRLGNGQFFGLLEETRISNVARIGCDPGEIVTQDIRRNFFYSGWRVIEERQQTGEAGQQLGDEIVSRQFVDGNGIDEHLQLRVFNGENLGEFEELYFHENARGDVVALTNDIGDVALSLEYSSYGVPYVVDDAGELEEFGDFESVVYGFQGRRIDQETSLMYYRNRYYNQELGRFLQRDPLGYVDSFGLYEAFGGNPFNYSDPFGKEDSWLGSLWSGVKTATSFVGRTLLGAGAAPTAYVMDSLGFKESAELVYDNLTIRSEYNAAMSSDYVAYMANYFNDEQANAINATFTTAGAAWGGWTAEGLSIGGAGPTGGVSLALSPAFVAGGTAAGAGIGYGAGLIFNTIWGSINYMMGEGSGGSNNSTSPHNPCPDISFTRRQLQKKFDKHASDFLDSKKYPLNSNGTIRMNNQSLSDFEKAIVDHMKDKDTIQQGVYGLNRDPVFYNKKTRNIIVKNKNNDFVTGFKLDKRTKQYKNYVKNGFLK
ncbi:RHS repeat-associated core domain-containing protein [Candidatus Uabimicrobium sp. HlEnr_7]|uniref:RHS repeat-associated core domain-containing protein n=1 Tax=Candidatus Uabimicrobium helgolandensis TaxID=3095367 RepID=UPI0035562FF9